MNLFRCTLAEANGGFASKFFAIWSEWSFQPPLILHTHSDVRRALNRTFLASVRLKTRKMNRLVWRFLWAKAYLRFPNEHAFLRKQLVRKRIHKELLSIIVLEVRPEPGRREAFIEWISRVKHARLPLWIRSCDRTCGIDPQIYWVFLLKSRQIIMRGSCTTPNFIKEQYTRQRTRILWTHKIVPLTCALRGCWTTWKYHSQQWRHFAIVMPAGHHTIPKERRQAKDKNDAQRTWDNAS